MRAAPRVLSRCVSGPCREASSQCTASLVPASGQAWCSEDRDGSLLAAGAQLLPQYKQCRWTSTISFNPVSSQRPAFSPSLTAAAAVHPNPSWVQSTSTSHQHQQRWPAQATAACDEQRPSCRTAVVLDGKAVAAQWQAELAAEVEQLSKVLGRPPGLGVVLVGERPDSLLYVNKKQEACLKAGLNAYIHRLPVDISQAGLEAAVQAVCARADIDGVLIQLPLPRHLSEEAVMEVLDPKKDVDGFHPLNMGRMLMRGRGVRLVPATPLGCIHLLVRSGIQIQGKSCVVVGDSNIVGTPLAAMLRDKGAAAVTVCHRLSYKEWFEDQDQVQRKRAEAAVCLPSLPGPRSSQWPSEAVAAAAAYVSLPPLSSSAPECFQAYQLPDITRGADILVVAVGHPELIRADWVRPGAVVLDVGINVVSAPPGTAHGASPEQQQQQRQLSREMDGAIAASEAAEQQRQQRSGGGGGGSAAAAAAAGGVLSEGSAGIGRPLGLKPGCSIVGDVAFHEVSQVASAITPVPGGVGPMTIAAVLHNTIKAAKYQLGLEPW